MVPETLKWDYCPRYPQAKMHAGYVIIITGTRLLRLNRGSRNVFMVDRPGGISSYPECRAWENIVIKSKPREKTRNETTVQKLRDMAGRSYDPPAKIRKYADAIAVELARIHGGRWRVQIDHLAGMVMVVRH